MFFCLLFPTALLAKGNVVKLPDGMSITLPDNWRVQPKEEGAPLLMAFGLEKDAERPFGMVMINQTPLSGQEEALTQDKLAGLSAEAKAAFLAEMETNFRAEFGGEKSPLKIKEILSTEIKDINGFHAASITAALDSEGNGVILEASIIMFADRAVQLQAWCSKAQYETHGKEVADIVKSFVAGKS